jgi:hypothetical protein
MLGFSVLLFLGRNTSHSPARQAIALGICVAMLGLSLTGIYEFTRGFVASGILIPIAIELVLAASYFYVWLINRHKVGELRTWFDICLFLRGNFGIFRNNRQEGKERWIKKEAFRRRKIRLDVWNFPRRAMDVQNCL